MKKQIESRQKELKSSEPSVATSTFFMARDHERRTAKNAVAKCIVETYLQEGGSIILDAGSSLYPIAEMIALRAKMEPGRTHFTIMTHNYKAFEVLVKVSRDANLNIILAGGRYDQDLNALFGNQTVNAYTDFFPRVVLLGISAFTTEIGLFCHGNTEELTVKRALFDKQARDRIIVADYTKIGQVNGFRYGEASGLRSRVSRCILVTDQPPDDAHIDEKNKFSQQVQSLRALNVEVNLVSGSKTSGEMVTRAT